MSATIETDGTVLLAWLRLLGWHTTMNRDGEQVVGVATHVAADGESLRVAGCARSDGDLALQLFEAAMGSLERPRSLARRLAA